MSRALLAPSILSADFGDLAGAIASIEQAGCEWIHLDVMDGHFVPPITFGAKMIADIRARTSLLLDAHLMVSNPETFVDDFADAGADLLTFHPEAVVHSHRLIDRIRDRGMRPGISIVPSTPPSSIEPLLPFVDLVLVMTVDPGYGGQKMIESCLDKLPELAAVRSRKALSFLLAIDGGVNLATLDLVKRAGPDVIVAGSAFFAAEEREALVRKVKALYAGASEC